VNLILLAGGIGAGKSSAAETASIKAGISVVNMRGVLAKVTGADPFDRAEMQQRAAALDRETDGRWLTDYLMALPERH
jgi:adenosyl cobinamide kinase/adenosyl cobinamide phosphate guanylyltransferase